MINFFTTIRHPYTIEPFLKKWPNPAARDFRLIPYEKMHLIRSITPGIFVFADIERLGPGRMEELKRFCEIISDNFDESLIINHPDRVLRRYELLSKLWEKEINDFRVFRCDAADSEIRYPIFMRRANDHNGSLTGIISDAEQRRLSLDKIRLAGTDLGEVIIVEFCDTSDEDGLYRKYSAFRVGDHIIPGHVLYSTDWVTKDTAPEPMRGEEKCYLQDNPHEAELMNIFDHANIEFGRVDYGMLRGKMQVWEINTNPVIIQDKKKYAKDKLPFKQLLVDSLATKFSQLKSRAEGVGKRKVDITGVFSKPWLRSPLDCILYNFRDI